MVGNPATEICVSVLRVDSDGLVKIGYGTIQGSLLQIGITSVCVGGCESRVEINGLIIVGYRNVELAFTKISITSIVESFSEPWVKVDSLIVIGDSTRWLKNVRDRIRHSVEVC